MQVAWASLEDELKTMVATGMFIEDCSWRRSSLTVGEGGAEVVAGEGALAVLGGEVVVGAAVVVGGGGELTARHRQQSASFCSGP